MTVASSMESYEARLASFSALHPPTKKQASESEGAKSLKWPHKSPSPIQLARAGFFYCPTPSSSDNARCYLCQCNLDGWEEDDSAIEEHLKHSSRCGWAVTVSIEKAIEDGDQDLENPMTERMQDARLMTFGTSWPHENKRGWKCKTQKMIEAGWHYSPTPESDDYAKCSYCNLSLDGWEPKDNPYDEHQRRSPECMFFQLSSAAVNKAGKSRKSRTSKMSRLSTPSDMTIASEAPLIAETEINEGDSVMSNSTTSKASKSKGGRKGGRKRDSTTKPNTKAAKAKTEAPSVASSYVEPEDDDFSVKVDQSPEVPQKSKKRKSDQMNGTDTIEISNSVDGQPQPPPAKRRTTRTRHSTQVEPVTTVVSQIEGDNDVHMADEEQVPLPQPPKLKRPGKGGRKRASTTTRKASITSTASKASLRVAAPDDEAIEAALAEDLDRPLTDNEDDNEPAQIKPPKGRRLTRTKPGSRDATASVAPTRRNTGVDIAVEIDATDKQSSDTPPVASNQATSPGGVLQAPDDEQVLIEEPKTKVRGGKRNVSRKIPAKEKPTGKESKSEIPMLDNPSESELPSTQKLEEKSQRQLQVRKSRGSAASSFQASDDIVADGNILTLDAETVGNVSGHGVDANSASQSHGKRGGRKGASTAKKGRAGKAGKVGKNSISTNPEIDNIVLPPTETVEIELDNDMDIEVVDVKEGTNAGSVAAEKPRKASRATGRPPKGKKLGSKAEETTMGSPAAASLHAQDDTAPQVTSPQPPSAHSTPKQGVSPQSSDAENQPPSSRPSALRPPLTLQSPSRSQTTRIPLAVSTPTRSPTKNTFSKLQSSFPWTAVDIEQIFRSTPNADKENNPFASKDGASNATLTSPEKKMSVEQWIQFNAHRGEEKSRSECEWMVGRFENEGVRALRTLEGIVCASS